MWISWWIILSASFLENMLACKDVIRGGGGEIRVGDVVIQIGHSF